MVPPSRKDACFAEGRELGDGAAAGHDDGRCGEQVGQLVVDEVGDVVAVGGLRRVLTGCSVLTGASRWNSSRSKSCPPRRASLALKGIRSFTYC